MKPIPQKTKCPPVMPDGSILGKSGQYAVIGDKRFYYEIHGNGEPLLLMHGGLDTIETLHTLAGELSRHYKVIMPEQTGHGRTPDIPGEHTYLRRMSDTVDLLDFLGIKDAHLAGFSDGAIISLFMGIHHPDRVKRIVSIGGNFHYAGLARRFREIIGAMEPGNFIKKEPATFALYAAASPDGPDHFPVVFEKVRRMWLTTPALSVKNVGRISSPALVVAADRDLISLEHTVKLFKALPKGQLLIVPGASHMLFKEKPDLVNRAIIDFLGEC